MKLPSLLSGAWLLLACSGPGAAAPAAPTTPAQQVAAGRELYASSCASCHGAHGNDGKAPAVIGLEQGALPLEPPPKAALRIGRFTTAADVQRFVQRTMPPKAPGSLSDEDYAALTAFMLSANGVALGEKPLDLTVADSIVIPRR